jgi:hypothetical protein
MDIKNSKSLQDLPTHFIRLSEIKFMYYETTARNNYIINLLYKDNESNTISIDDTQNFFEIWKALLELLETQSFTDGYFFVRSDDC